MIAIGSNINQLIFDKPNLHPTTSRTYATEPLSPLYFRLAFFQSAYNLFFMGYGYMPSALSFSREIWNG
jgi:hypothetical protein